MKSYKAILYPKSEDLLTIFSVPKIINIGKDLSEIFEKITSVRFFLDPV